MAWLNLEDDIREEFSDSRLDRREVVSGFRLFRVEKSEEVIARVARWRRLNRERHNAACRARAKAHPEKVRAYQKATRERTKADPVKLEARRAYDRELKRRTRAAKKVVPGTT